MILRHVTIADFRWFSVRWAQYGHSSRSIAAYRAGYLSNILPDAEPWARDGEEACGKMIRASLGPSTGRKKCPISSVPEITGGAAYTLDSVGFSCGTYWYYDMRCFLSYNKADKEIARSVGAHITLNGLEIWFDEWEIQAGDSIPGKLNEGLAGFDAFILIWSRHANGSNWVRQELHTAIMRAMTDGSAKIIPCVLDRTPLPPLISDRRYVDFTDTHTGIEELLGDLTGARTKRARLLAIQRAIEEMDVQWTPHPLLLPMVCCPNCGETETLEGWEQQGRRGDLYAGLRCSKCGWSDGSEV